MFNADGSDCHNVKCGLRGYTAMRVRPLAKLYARQQKSTSQTNSNLMYQYVLKELVQQGQRGLLHQNEDVYDGEDLCRD